MASDWNLTLYIAGTAPESIRAQANLDTLVKEYLQDFDVQITICDLLESPALARENNILALPTLVREKPKPMARIIGDLSDMADLWSAIKTP